MTWNGDRKSPDEGNRLRERYLSRLQEISGKIETRSHGVNGAVAVEEPPPAPFTKPAVSGNPGVAATRETASASLPDAVSERPHPKDDDTRPIAEQLASKLVDALSPLFGEIDRGSLGVQERIDAAESHLRDQQRILLALEEKILQLEQRTTAQQELLKEQILRATTTAMSLEQRFAVLDGRMNAQAGAIRNLHNAQDQRRDELRVTLQRLGELSGKKTAAALPENL